MAYGHPGDKIHPLFAQKPYIPPKKYSAVTMIVEDLETGEMVTHRFPKVENFQVGVNPVEDPVYGDHTWGFTGYAHETLLSALPLNHSRIVTSGIAMPTDNSGMVVKTQVFEK